jgi:putative transposase
VYLNGYSAMGELMIGLTKYFAFYNGERPHQALRNQTPDAVHNSSVGGEAMIMNKYGAKPEPSGLPIALRSMATAFGEVKIGNQSEMQSARTGTAPSSCVKSGAT